MHFTVKVDADAEYRIALKLEEQFAKYIGQLDGLMYTAYGFPMPGKVRKAEVKPGIVVSVRSKHAKHIEKQIRKLYPRMYANHLPIFIDVWD